MGLFNKKVYIKNTNSSLDDMYGYIKSVSKQDDVRVFIVDISEANHKYKLDIPFPRIAISEKYLEFDKKV